MPVSPPPPWAQRSRPRPKASPRPLSAVPLLRSPLAQRTQFLTPVPPAGSKARSRVGLPFDRPLSVDAYQQPSPRLDRNERRPSAGVPAGRPVSARTPHTAASPFETPQRPGSAWKARAGGGAGAVREGPSTDVVRPHSAHVPRSSSGVGLSTHFTSPLTAPAEARDRPRRRPHTAKERVKKELFPAGPSRPQSSKRLQRPRTAGKTPAPESEPLHRLPSAPSKDKDDAFFRDPPALPGRRIMRQMEGQEMELWKTFRSCRGTRQNHADFDSWIEGVEFGLSHISGKQPYNVTNHMLDATEKEKYLEEQQVMAKERELAQEKEEAEELQRLHAEATEREKQVLKGLHNGEWLGEQDEEEEVEVDQEALEAEQLLTGILLECPLTRDLEYEQLQELAKNMDKKSFEKGEVILSQGEPLTDKFYVIKEGTALVYWTDEEGHRHRCATLRKNADFGLGEISICPPCSKGFNADIVADSAVMLHVIERLPFLSECETLEAAHGTCLSPFDDYLHQLEFDMGPDAVYGAWRRTEVCAYPGPARRSPKEQQASCGQEPERLVMFSGDGEKLGSGEHAAQPPVSDADRAPPHAAATRDTGVPAPAGDSRPTGLDSAAADRKDGRAKARPAAADTGGMPEVISWHRPEQNEGEDFEAFTKRDHTSLVAKDTASVDSVLDIISRCQVFDYMSKLQRRRMLPKLFYEAFDTGQYVVKQGGKEGDFMFIVFSGTLECFKMSRKGVKKVLRTYGEGEYFGEIALLKRQPRAANVVALEPCQLICISGRMLDDAQVLAHARNRLEKLLENYYNPNLKALFHAYDTDGDGLLQEREFRTLLNVLGYAYSDAEFSRGFNKLETSWQGELDFNDFLEFWEGANFFDPLGVKERQAAKSKHDLMLRPEGVTWEEEDMIGHSDADQEFEDEVLSLQTRAAEEARSFWRTYDTDGSGTMDKDELMEMLQDLGFDDCSEERVEREMRLMDAQGKGEVELEDFTDWWIMLQTQIFTDNKNQMLLPLEAIKAVVVHHPTVFLSLERSKRVFETIDTDQDGFIKPDDLLNAIMDKKTHQTVNKLGVALGYAAKEGDPIDRESFDSIYQQMDSLEQDRIDVDQFVGYFGPKREEEEPETPKSTKSRGKSFDAEGKQWIEGKGFAGSNRANSFDGPSEDDEEPGSSEEGAAGGGQDGEHQETGISTQKIANAVRKFRTAARLIGIVSEFRHVVRTPPVRTKEQAIWAHLTRKRSVLRIASTSDVPPTKSPDSNESGVQRSASESGESPMAGARPVRLPAASRQEALSPKTGVGHAVQGVPVPEDKESSSHNIFADLEKKGSHHKLGKHHKNSTGELELLELPKKGKPKMVSRAVPAPVSNRAPNDLIDACVRAFSEHDWDALMDLLKRGVSMAKNDIFARALLGEDTFFLRTLTAVVGSQSKELKLHSLEMLRVLVYCPKLVQQHMPNGNNLLAQEVAAQTMIELVGNEEESPEVRRAAAHVLHGCVDVHENNTLFLMESEIKNAKETCWWRSSFFGEGDEAEEMRIDTVQLPPRARASISLCFQKLEPPVMPPIKRKQRHKKKQADREGSESDRDDMSESSSVGRSGSAYSIDQELRRSASGDWESEISEGTEAWSDMEEGDEKSALEQRRARFRDPAMPERELQPEMKQQEVDERIMGVRKEKLDKFLRSVPLFEVLTERADRDTLAEEMTVRIFLDGERLLQQGDQHGDTFFVVYNGSLVEKKAAGPNGTAVYTRVFGPGEVVGDDALLEETAQQASVYAKGTCLVFAFAVEQLYFIRDKLKALYHGTKTSKLKSSLSFRIEAKSSANSNMKLFVQAVDFDGNGEISEDELLILMRKLGAECPESEIQRVFDDVDNDGDGKIDYEEFGHWWDNVNYFDIMGVQTYKDEEDSEWYDRARVKQAWDSVLAEKKRSRARNSANLIGDNRSISQTRGASPAASRRRSSVAVDVASNPKMRRGSVVDSYATPNRRRGSVVDSGTPVSSRRRGSVALESFVTPQRPRRNSLEVVASHRASTPDGGRRNNLLAQAALRSSHGGGPLRDQPPLRAASSSHGLGGSDGEGGESPSPPRRRTLEDSPPHTRGQRARGDGVTITDGLSSSDPAIAVDVRVNRLARLQQLLDGDPPAWREPAASPQSSPPSQRPSPMRNRRSVQIADPIVRSPTASVRRDALFQSSAAHKVMNSKLMLHDLEVESIREQEELKHKQARAAKKIAKSKLARHAFMSDSPLSESFRKHHQ